MHRHLDGNPLSHALGDGAKLLELLELVKRTIEVLHMVSGHTQGQYGLDMKHPHAPFRIAARIGLHLAAQRSRVLLELAQGEQQ